MIPIPGGDDEEAQTLVPHRFSLPHRDVDVEGSFCAFDKNLIGNCRSVFHYIYPQMLPLKIDMFGKETEGN